HDLSPPPLLLQELVSVQALVDQPLLKLTQDHSSLSASNMNAYVIFRLWICVEHLSIKTQQLFYALQQKASKEFSHTNKPNTNLTKVITCN
ncbi:MAG: hypothetical protein RL373_1886, partial [Pseudomonadota bacterium]